MTGPYTMLHIKSTNLQHNLTYAHRQAPACTSIHTDADINAGTDTKVPVHPMHPLHTHTNTHMCMHAHTKLYEIRKNPN
jgi:hypothetical protein